MRYRLIAFVCDQNCVKWINNDGSSEYTDILTQRPDACRFAVVQYYDKYLCFDLFDTQINPETLKIYEPNPLTFDTLDAAVMAGQMKL